MSCVVPNCQQAKISNEKISMHLFPDPLRDPQRHLCWVKLINSERIFKFDPYVVFKRFRVCRVHFNQDCFNGECKKLLNTATPSLHLGNGNPAKLKSKYLIYEAKVISLLKKNSVNVEDETLKLINITQDDSRDESHLLKLPDEEIKISYQEKLWNSADEDNENEEFVLMEVVNDSENQSKFTIVLPQENIQASTKVLNYNQKIKSPNKSGVSSSPKIVNIKPKLSPIQPLTKAKLKLFHTNFSKSPKNLLAQSICTKANPFEILPTYCKSDFAHKIDLKLNENDKEYWCHAPFKLMRLSFMQHLNLDEFEFSQSHFFYYDLIERCYYFLHKIAENLKRGDKIDSQLENPLNEGKGNWSIFLNIINKHGVVPKQCSSIKLNHQVTSRFTEIIKSKLREFAKVLIDSLSKCSTADIQLKIDEQMNEIYSIFGILFGTISDKFTWEYKDRNDKLYSIGPLTSNEFYEQYVKPHFNVDNKISIVSDARSKVEYNKSYVVNNIGIVGGRQTIYNNQPIEVLIDLVSKSISHGEAVLAICNKNCINDFQLQNLRLICDIPIESKLDKSERTTLNDFSQKEMMIFNAIDSGKQKFRLENFNSNETDGLIITQENFNNIVSEIIIDKKFFNKELDAESINLDSFDVINTLAI